MQFQSSWKPTLLKSHFSSPSKVFLGKGVLKICIKFTRERPCQSVISAFAFKTLNFLSCRSNVILIWEYFISKYKIVPTVITIYKTTWHICDLQKQPYRGVLGKRCSEIWTKFTGEHPCRSAISMKLLSSFIEIALRHGCSPINLLHIFRTLFPKNTSGWLLLDLVIDVFLNFNIM